jgi:hypothetical protein
VIAFPDSKKWDKHISFFLPYLCGSAGHNSIAISLTVPDPVFKAFSKLNYFTLKKPACRQREEKGMYNLEEKLSGLRKTERKEFA